MKLCANRSSKALFKPPERSRGQLGAPFRTNEVDPLSWRLQLKDESGSALLQQRIFLEHSAEGGWVCLFVFLIRSAVSHTAVIMPQLLLIWPQCSLLPLAYWFTFTGKIWASGAIVFVSRHLVIPALSFSSYLPLSPSLQLSWFFFRFQIPPPAARSPPHQAKRRLLKP